MSEVERCQIATPDTELDDLRARLALTRWPIPPGTVRATSVLYEHIRRLILEPLDR